MRVVREVVIPIELVALCGVLASLKKNRRLSFSRSCGGKMVDGDIMRDRRLIAFIDKEASRSCAIKAASVSPSISTRPSKPIRFAIQAPNKFDPFEQRLPVVSDRIVRLLHRPYDLAPHSRGDQLSAKPL